MRDEQDEALMRPQYPKWRRVTLPEKIAGDVTFAFRYGGRWPQDTGGEMIDVEDEPVSRYTMNEIMSMPQIACGQSTHRRRHLGHVHVRMVRRRPVAFWCLGYPRPIVDARHLGLVSDVQAAPCQRMPITWGE